MLSSVFEKTVKLKKHTFFKNGTLISYLHISYYMGGGGGYTTMILYLVLNMINLINICPKKGPLSSPSSQPAINGKNTPISLFYELKIILCKDHFCLKLLSYPLSEYRVCRK